jgi:peptidoglycan/xylan/chitin deacetylase (PgdA/CDA1 family)
MSLKIHIADDLPGRHIIHYTLQLIAINKGIQFIYTPHADGSELQITDDLSSDIPLCGSFYQNLTTMNFEALKQITHNSYFFYSENGKKDHLASIFFLVNCIQEYGEAKTDKYGRYPYAESIQKRENSLHLNLVPQLIDEFLSAHPILKKLQTSRRKSAFFLTHDIDTVYGAKNQNGDYALKTHQYHKIPRLLLDHYIGTPDWLNMDKIMALEKQYGFRSTFYWLVYKDKDNADYLINSTPVKAQLKQIEDQGFEIGLHKSLRNTSFKEELNLLDTFGPIEGQRYHFLRFNLPAAWNELENAGLKLDTSLGFPDDFGFRNNYGLPFMPFNLKENRVYDLIEVPMNIMDGNFFYQGKTIAQAEKELIDWLDKNKEGTVITINFHNNFFDDMLYSGYDKLYISLLKYFKEEGLACVTQKDLIREFYKPEFYNYPLS